MIVRQRLYRDHLAAIRCATHRAPLASFQRAASDGNLIAVRLTLIAVRLTEVDR
jgi:hypothetical protein